VKVLVVDDDTVRRAMLVDLLGGLNHQVRAVSSAGHALDAHLALPVDVVVASGLFGGVAGVEMTTRLQTTPRPPGVVLVFGQGDGGVQQLAASRGVALRGCLPWPADPTTLAVLVQPPIAVVSAGSAEWSGLGFLETVRGPVDRVPLARLLFLAHRVGASGAAAWSGPAGAGRIFLKAGAVIQVEGVPGLFDALDDPPPEGTDLMGGVALAMRGRQPYATVMEAVSLSLATWLVAPDSIEGATVWFELDAKIPPGAVPLGSSVPRLLAQGLAAARTDAALARLWDARARSTVRVRVPDDSAESRWGLDATAMRLLKLASECTGAGDLLARASGKDTQRLGPVLRALELLVLLGLISLDGGRLPADDASSSSALPPPVAAAQPRVPPPPTRREPAAPTQEDGHAERLRAALAGMEGAHPMDLLGLADRATITEADISSAYREVSRRFHPDTYFNASPVVRGLAEACFARVNGAYETLSAPGGLVDAQRFIASRKAGRGFVTEREHQSARVSFKRAELLFKNRDWRGADQLYLEAARLDTSTWPHVFHAIRCGALSRRLTVAQAVAQLDALTTPNPAARADVQVAAGNLFKLDGRHGEAMARYKQALEADPNNRDAQREIRLHDSRREGEAAVASSATSKTSVLSGFFRRGGDPK
jgi:CheY-like chemotaxis protein/tetratricopeptide (TPR) repeat protein